MTGQRNAFLITLLLNLLAAYGPTAFWLPYVPGVQRPIEGFLFSPVAFVAFILWTNVERWIVWLSVLVVFVGLLATLSILLSRLRTPTVPAVVVFLVVAAYSLLQGIAFAALLGSVNAAI